MRESADNDIRYFFFYAYKLNPEKILSSLQQYELVLLFVQNAHTDTHAQTAQNLRQRGPINFSNAQNE